MNKLFQVYAQGIKNHYYGGCGKMKKSQYLENLFYLIE